MLISRHEDPQALFLHARMTQAQEKACSISDGWGQSRSTCHSIQLRNREEILNDTETKWFDAVIDVRTRRMELWLRLMVLSLWASLASLGTENHITTPEELSAPSYTCGS
jgi:hypothetical protein